MQGTRNVYVLHAVDHIHFRLDVASRKKWNANYGTTDIESPIL
jgi:hypothetical protein